MAQKSGSSSKASKEFNFMSFVWRLAATLALVLLTYNPTRFSYWGWLKHAQSSETAALGCHVSPGFSCGSMPSTMARCSAGRRSKWRSPSARISCIDAGREDAQ